MWPVVGSSNPRKCCVALEENGDPCLRIPDNPHHEDCLPHHKEYKNIYREYKTAESHYENLGAVTSELGLEKRREKATIGRRVWNLRTQMNHRFFSANNRSHVQWILKMGSELDALEDKLGDVNLPTQSQTGEALSRVEELAADKMNSQQPEDAMLVRRSPLSPEIPLNALNHSADDHPVKVLKQSNLTALIDLIMRLYDIVPSLDDSADTLRVTVGETGRHIRKELDEGDHAIRFIFREFILYKADAGTISRARRTSSIDGFLIESFPSEVLDYIKFFNERFGRQDTLHFLRDAVCDYLLDRQSSSTVILGGISATEETERKMTIEGWDILYRHFDNEVVWWNVGYFCSRSDDLSLISKLVALGGYGHETENESGWFCKANDVAQECPLAVLRGFIGGTKGFSDPLPVFPTKNGDVSTEKLSRCYIAGTMSKSEPLVLHFAQDLVKRVARFLVFVRDQDPDS